MEDLTKYLNDPRWNKRNPSAWAQYQDLVRHKQPIGAPSEARRGTLPLAGANLGSTIDVGRPRLPSGNLGSGFFASLRQKLHDRQLRREGARAERVRNQPIPLPSTPERKAQPVPLSDLFSDQRKEVPPAAITQTREQKRRQGIGVLPPDWLDSAAPVAPQPASVILRETPKSGDLRRQEEGAERARREAERARQDTQRKEAQRQDAKNKEQDRKKKERNAEERAREQKKNRERPQEVQSQQSYPRERYRSRSNY